MRATDIVFSFGINAISLSIILVFYLGPRKPFNMVRIKLPEFENITQEMADQLDKDTMICHIVILTIVFCLWMYSIFLFLR